MPAISQAAATGREYRAIVPIEGYVHKFRLEAREEAAARALAIESATPTVSLGALLGKFVLITLALAGIGAAGVLLATPANAKDVELLECLLRSDARTLSTASERSLRSFAPRLRKYNSAYTFPPWRLDRTPRWGRCLDI
jgi:hypothetical protein